MENEQGVWMLHIILLSLNCLISKERAIATKIHLLIGAAKLIQFSNFKNALASKFKYKDRLQWKRVFACVSMENVKL